MSVTFLHQGRCPVLFSPASPLPLPPTCTSLHLALGTGLSRNGLKWVFYSLKSAMQAARKVVSPTGSLQALVRITVCVQGTRRIPLSPPDAHAYKVAPSRCWLHGSLVVTVGLPCTGVSGQVEFARRVDRPGRPQRIPHAPEQVQNRCRGLDFLGQDLLMSPDTDPNRLPETTQQLLPALLSPLCSPNTGVIKHLTKVFAEQFGAPGCLRRRRRPLTSRSPWAHGGALPEGSGDSPAGTTLYDELFRAQWLLALRLKINLATTESYMVDNRVANCDF